MQQNIIDTEKEIVSNVSNMNRVEEEFQGPEKDVKGCEGERKQQSIGTTVRRSLRPTRDHDQPPKTMNECPPLKKRRTSMNERRDDEEILVHHSREKPTLLSEKGTTASTTSSAVMINKKNKLIDGEKKDSSNKPNAEEDSKKKLVKCRSQLVMSVATHLVNLNSSSATTTKRQIAMKNAAQATGEQDAYSSSPETIAESLDNNEDNLRSIKYISTTSVEESIDQTSNLSFKDEDGNEGTQRFPVKVSFFSSFSRLLFNTQQTI